MELRPFSTMNVSSRVLIGERLCGCSTGCGIHQSCNPVTSPAVRSGNVSLPVAQNIRHPAVTCQRSRSPPGGQGHSRHSAFHWTAGQWFNWWRAVAQCCFYLADWWMFLFIYFFSQGHTQDGFVFKMVRMGKCLFWTPLVFSSVADISDSFCQKRLLHYLSAL